MAAKRRERTVEELYNYTEAVLEPKITPVLRGSYRIQGPIDETDNGFLKNMVSPRSRKRFTNCFMNQKVHMRGESGTCNVCSAPCSSCMHLKRALTGSKTEEFSDETCRVNATSQYSVNEADALSSVKSRACDSSLLATSETSNQLSVNSSHESFSENADSKAAIRSSDAADFSVDIDMHKKSYDGGIVAEGHIATESSIRGISHKDESIKGVEGHDDNTSCVSGSSNANMAAGSHRKVADNKNLSCGSASVGNLCPEGSGKAEFSCKLDFSETPASKEVGSTSPEACTLYSVSQSGKPLSGIDFEQNPTTLVKGEPSESSLDHNDSLTREVVTTPAYGQKSITNECSLDGGNFEVSLEKLPKSEEDIHVDGSGPPDGGMKNQCEDEQDENFKDLSESLDVQEPPFQSASGYESDESDIVEHDVKVCDICGDAGREDLLAICSRCTDGAEHTYCMREMLKKVPEGDWLCEECKTVEENENQKQDVEGKSYISYPKKDEGKRTNIASPTTQVSDAEGKRVSSLSTRISGKKHVENADVSAAAKRQVPEASKGSTKSSSPGRNVGLSRDSSSKSLDRGKLMLSHQKCLDDQCGNDVAERARSPSLGIRVQTHTGTLSKSNSFNTINSKPKVKLVDEFIPPKQKGAREHTSLEVKEGPARMLRKSQSFKTPNSGRTSMNESKVKMLPSKFPHVQDPKGLKQLKDRNIFDRKNPSKVDRSWSSVTTNSAVSSPKVDQKLTLRGETNLLSSVGNNRDQKVMQSDGISNTQPKLRSSVVHKGVDNPLSPVRALSTNGICSSSPVDQKINHVSPKEEPASSSLTVERTSYNDNGRSREMTGQDDKNRESSASQSKPSVTTSPKSAHCQKCKGTEHATESCMSGSPHVSDNNIISYKEEIHEDNKLKAAIQAALLKRPEIYKKRKFNEQSDEISSSSTVLNSDIVHQDNLKKKEISAERTYEGKAIISSSTTNCHKQLAASISKPVTLSISDAPVPLNLEDTDSPVIPVEKPRMKDLSGHGSTSLFLKMSVIPEYEYIWQGGFELHRGGKLPDFCDGIQAHLSTCASPKVIEVANRLPHNISLKEVPRLSMWPAQFHDSGVKEDNIALYFFARDIHSYERNYKSLLDNMIENDLALKGNLDGVELLIFSSNQLPENSQRWNMLFFLWGVFRGKKANCSDTLKALNIRGIDPVPLDKDFPDTMGKKSDNVCSPKCLDRESFACDRSSKKGQASSLMDQNSDTISSNCHKFEPSFHQTQLDSLENSGNQDDQFESKSSPILATCTEFRQGSVSTAPTNESCHSECTRDEQFKPCIKVKEIGGVDDNEKMQLQLESYSVEDTSSLSKTSDMEKTSAGQKIVDRRVCEGEKVILSTAEGNLGSEALSKRDLNMKGINCLDSHHRKRQLIDISEPAPPTSIGANKRTSWDEVDCILLDEENVSKKPRTGFGNLYENSSSCKISQSDAYVSPSHDMGPTFSLQKKRDDKPCDVIVIPEDFDPPEKDFFPVDYSPHQIEDRQLALSTKDEDQYHDAVPNLELALGAETKLPKKSMIPFFMGLVDEKRNQSESSEKAIDGEEDDDSTSLTLSLSFPFPDKQQSTKTVSKTEQLLPDRRHVNTSLLLFGGLSEK